MCEFQLDLHSMFQLALIELLHLADRIHVGWLR